MIWIDTAYFQTTYYLIPRGILPFTLWHFIQVQCTLAYDTQQQDKITVLT
jgi:hypothetical protein